MTIVDWFMPFGAWPLFMAFVVGAYVGLRRVADAIDRRIDPSKRAKR